MRNAVGKDGSTLRTAILLIFGFVTLLILHNTFFQLRTTKSNFNCVSAFNRPFMKPDDQRRQPGYRIPKNDSFN